MEFTTLSWKEKVISGAPQAGARSVRQTSDLMREILESWIPAVIIWLPNPWMLLLQNSLRVREHSRVLLLPLIQSCTCCINGDQNLIFSSTQGLEENIEMLAFGILFLIPSLYLMNPNIKIILLCYRVAATSSFLCTFRSAHLSLSHTHAHTECVWQESERP